MLELSIDEFLESIERNRILLKRQLAVHSELGMGLTQDLVCVAPESLKHCFSELDRHEIDAIDQYMEDRIRSENFMPFPTSYMTPAVNATEKKKELRPRYLAIDRLIAEAKKKWNAQERRQE